MRTHSDGVSPSNDTLTTGVSKIAASIASVDATFTTTSLWHIVSARCRWLSAVMSIARPSPALTVERNGFSIITCGTPSNCGVGVEIVARMQPDQHLRRLHARRRLAIARISTRST